MQQKVQQELFKQFNGLFRPDVKFDKDNREVIMDGVTFSPDGSVQEVVEIVSLELPDFSKIPMYVTQVRNEMERQGLERARLRLVVVAEEITGLSAKELLNKYGKSANLTFYKLNSEDMTISLVEPLES